MKGFTLIETLVVISITVILSGIVLAYNRSTDRQIILYRDQGLIVGLINRAKSLAIQKYRNPDNPLNPACAFGVHFEPSPSRKFILFQDLGQGGCATGRTYAYNAGANPSEKLEEFQLDSKLQFTDLPTGGVDIAFIPPDLTATTTESDGLPTVITIKTISDSVSASITVSAGGQIVQ